MSEGGDEDAIKWQGPDDEYGQDLSPDEGGHQHEEPNELQPFFEEESIIPGGIHRANESYLADDNILQMLADDKTINQKTSRNQSAMKKKGVSKDKTRKKHSLSKNRVNGKDSYVMRNTFEDLSNRMMAKSILTANSLAGSVRDTSNIAMFGARKPGVYKEPTTLSNLDHILISPNTGNHLERLDLRYETTADCTASSKAGHPHHLAVSEVAQKTNPVSQRKGPNFSLFSNVHIEKRDSPVAPKSHFEIPMQMKTEVIKLRKTSEIDREITDTINSKRNLHNQEKGPIRILKNIDQPNERTLNSSKERKTNTNLPPRSSLKKRRTAAPSKDVSIHDEESPDKDKHQRRVSGFSKGSIDKKSQQPVHHFKTIQEVLAQNNSNYQV